MKRLLLIDLSGLFRANWHATEHQEIGEAFSRTVAKVNSLREGFDYVVVCCDKPPYKRKELYEQYKAQRDAPPPQLTEQMERVKERLRADGLLVWESEGHEADDLIASAVPRAVADELAVVIASSDKDLYALIDDERQVALQTMTGQLMNEAACVEKFNVAPVLIPELLALWGDDSDNIPGVPGVGKVHAANLLKMHGPTADDVIANADDIKSAKLRDSVLGHVDSIRLARRLVQLNSDVPLKWDELYEEREPKPLTKGKVADWDDAEFEEEQPVAAAEKKSEPQAEQPRAKVVTALATVPHDYSKALEPRSGQEAFIMAKYLHNSRLYQRYGSQEAIFAIICRGREMGLGALTSLDAFHNYQGKPMMHAHLIIARAKQDPDCEYFQFLGGNATYAEYETKAKSNPRPTRLKYTIEEARDAGLVRNGGNWAQRPAEMLRKTCAVQLARIEFPSAALGLYCPEEMGVDL